MCEEVKFLSFFHSLIGSGRRRIQTAMAIRAGLDFNILEENVVKMCR